MTTRSTPSLLNPIHTFLEALTSSPTSPTYITTILSTFTTQPVPLIHEHGLPQLAPFLGRSFTGTDGIARYFELLGDYLIIRDMRFEPEETWVVDAEAETVVVRGRARFVWKSTRQGWDEEFVYRIALATDVSGRSSSGVGGGGGMGDDEVQRGVGRELDEGEKMGEERCLKVCEYRIWADTGAAYLARCGRLRDLLGEKGGGGVEGIHFDQDEDGEGERKKMEGRGETRAALNRRKSGHQDVLGAGLNVYGSCG